MTQNEHERIEVSDSTYEEQCCINHLMDQKLPNADWRTVKLLSDTDRCLLSGRHYTSAELMETLMRQDAY